MIKHIEMMSHPGGLTKLTIVCDGDKTLLGQTVSKVQHDPEKYEVQLKRISSKRGLTANAYYWVLVDHLSKALGTSKDEVHQEMMRDYGTFKLSESGKPVVFTIAAGEDPRQIAKYSRAFAEGYIGEKRFIHHAVLKGSSEMSAKEFGDLLDGLISECKEMGIETMTPEEVAKLDYIHSTDSPDNQKEQ